MSIYFDKRKRAFRFSFERVGPDGARKRATKLLPGDWDRSRAEDFDRKETARLLAEIHGIGERHRPTIAEAVGIYLAEKGPTLKSVALIRRDLALVAEHVAGRFVDELATVADAIKGAGAENGWAAATVRNRIAYLKAACRHAWKSRRWQMPEPGRDILMPTVHNARHVYPQRETMLRIARQFDRRDARLAFLTGFYTGARKSEVLRAVPRGEVFDFGETKNGDPKLVPIHPRLRCRLHLYPIAMSASTYDKAFARARDAAGFAVGDVRIHDLRHGTASEIINNGGDLFVVGKVLGHRSIQSSARYAHLLTERMVQHVDGIGTARKLTPAKKRSA